MREQNMSGSFSLVLLLFFCAVGNVFSQSPAVQKPDIIHEETLGGILQISSGEAMVRDVRTGRWTVHRQDTRIMTGDSMRLSSDFRGTIFLSSGGAIVPLKSSSIYHLTPTGLFTQNGPQWVEVISVSNPLGEMPPLPPLQQNIVPQTQVSETLQPERTSPSEGGQQFSKTMDTQPSYEDPEQKQRELEEWTRGLKHMEIRLTQMEQRLNVLNRQKQEIQRKIYRTQSLVRTSGNASSLQSRLIFFRRRKRMLEKEYREIQEEMRDSRQSVIQARNHIEQLKTN